MSSTYQLKQYPTIDHDDNNFLQNISSIALIGPSLLSKESLYDTKYHHIALWFIHNFYKSQDILAVQQIEEADIIFVPVTFDRRPEDLLLMNHFFNNALKLFPLLQKKPHVIALHLPLSRYLYGLNSSNCKYFTFISLNTDNGLNKDLNVVAAPYFWKVHYKNMADIAWKYNEKANKKEIENIQKEFLAAASWKPRKFSDDGLYKNLDKEQRKTMHIERLNWRQQCLQAFMTLDMKKQCQWIEWASIGSIDLHASAKIMFDISKKAWFTLMPQGDFISRVSMTESPFCDTINVMDYQVIQSLPYNNILKYEDFTLIVDVNTTDIISLMRNVSIEHRKKMILNQREIRNVFQFAIQPQYELLRWSEVDKLDPADDAFTFTIKALMKNLLDKKI